MNFNTPTIISKPKTAVKDGSDIYDPSKRIVGYNSITSEIGGRLILNEENDEKIGKLIDSFDRQISITTPQCDFDIEIYETDVIDGRISLKSVTAATVVEANNQSKAVGAIPNKLTKRIDIGRIKFELYEKGLNGIAYNHHIGDSCMIMPSEGNCIEGYISGFVQNEGYRPSTVIFQPKEPNKDGFPPIPESIKVDPNDII